MSLETPEEKYDISGKGLTPKDKEGVAILIKKNKLEALKPIDGELEKTPEQLKMIDMINDQINEELEGLNIKKRINILPEKIHFLPGHVYEREFPNKARHNVPAFNTLPNEEVFVDLSSSSKYRKVLYGMLLHEEIHISSAEKFLYNVHNRSCRLRGSGYLDIKKLDTERCGLHEHFRGFNEMVIGKLTDEIMEKHKKELAKEFKFSKEEKKSKTFGIYTAILDLIISEVARRNEEKIQDVWNRFKKGLFTGEVIHLRDVEKTFGKGSLRVIGALYSGTKDTKSGIDQGSYYKIIDYLITNDEGERDKIAEEILIDREYEAYKKQRGEK